VEVGLGPGLSQRKSEFISMAIRKALWELEEKETGRLAWRVSIIQQKLLLMQASSPSAIVSNAMCVLSARAGGN